MCYWFCLLLVDIQGTLSGLDPTKCPAICPSPIKHWNILNCSLNPERPFTWVRVSKRINEFLHQGTVLSTSQHQSSCLLLCFHVTPLSIYTLLPKSLKRLTFIFDSAVSASVACQWNLPFRRIKDSLDFPWSAWLWYLMYFQCCFCLFCSSYCLWKVKESFSMGKHG